MSHVHRKYRKIPQLFPVYNKCLQFTTNATSLPQMSCMRFPQMSCHKFAANVKSFPWMSWVWQTIPKPQVCPRGVTSFLLRCYKFATDIPSLPLISQVCQRLQEFTTSTYISQVYHIHVPTYRSSQNYSWNNKYICTRKVRKMILRWPHVLTKFSYKS